MADSASPILLQRIQSVGSNVNLWGGYINTDLQMLEQAAKGYQSLAVTGDATISWVNYTLGNTGSIAFLKLTGSVTGVLTFPAYQNYLSVWNANSASVTIKCSGGTGVTLTSGQRALLYCDGTDYYNAAPNVLGAGNVTVSGQITGVTAATTATGAVNKNQMETAIATASLPATAGTFLISALDTTAGYAGTKIVEGTGIDLTDSGAGNSTLTVSVDTNELPEFTATTGTETSTITNSSTPMTAKRMYRFTGTGPAVLPTMVAGDFVDVIMAQAAGTVGTIGRNSQTIDGTADDDAWTGTGVRPYPVVRYSYVSAGAVKSELIGSMAV